MITLSGKSKDTLQKLRDKSELSSNLRMPPITRIHDLLVECGIKHEFRKSVNVVECRSGGNRYVNDRHDGKEGYLLEYKAENQDEAKQLDTWTISLDTSDSYYSFNTDTYARKLLKLINIKLGL